MKVEIKVPSMGESITEATVGVVLKPTGSKVAMDEEILELETDKVNQVLYAPAAGIISWNVSSSDVVKIGQILGSVDTSAAAQDGKEKAPAPAVEKKETVQKIAESGKKASEKEPMTAPQERSFESPSKKSKEAFVSGLAEAQSAPAAAYPKEEKTMPLKQAVSRTETRQKLSRIRKVIATRLVEVQKTTAMLTTFNEVDLSHVMGLREKYKDLFAKQHQAKLGFMSFFVKAVVAALRAVPQMNSYIDGEDLVHREYIDIGIAVGTDKGLVVPIVRNCDQLSFAGIEQAIENYAKRAREGTLSINDLQGGGFTITNGGIYGSLLSTPILSPAQCGILGMHKIEKRPVVVNDQIVIRPMMYLALSYDHRIIDGKEAVTFLVKVKEALEDPHRLLLEV
jgi:2-oxoglutarate dehydrogenase E2 component (dihydrolipoamide succinyltransferase)